MQYIKSRNYDEVFLRENMMGPNALKLLEELLSRYPLHEGATVLDLGCGRGMTSLMLVREYALHVFAADLWIDPTENWQRFDAFGLAPRRIVPLRAEAHALPFAQAFFDAVISVDSYHYFGLDETYPDEHLLPLLKPGGLLLIVVPGLKRDIHHDIPTEMLRSWSSEDISTLHDAAYWRRILAASKGAELLDIYEMEGYDECWEDWLACDNEYAIKDRAAMQCGAGRYMNLLAMALRRK